LGYKEYGWKFGDGKFEAKTEDGKEKKDIGLDVDTQVKGRCEKQRKIQ
jgi:hypothetical protein